MKHEFPLEHLLFIHNAIGELDGVLSQKPDDLHANYNKAMLLLSIGEFERGWKLFEWRFKILNSIFSYEWFPVPRWDYKSDVTGKHVLVWLEQGIGDQIMGASMVPDIAAKAASVTLMADRRFADLCRRSFPANVEFYKFGDPISPRLKAWDYDCQLSMADLGFMFRKKFEDFPGVTFLKPDADKVAALRAKYKKAGGDRPLVGFSWMSANVKYGALKSIPPDDYIGVLKDKDVQYVSLQYGDNPIDMDMLRQRGAEFIVDPSIDPLISLDDSAAQIAAMDHVVSVSNSTVHLAGAMGVPTTAMIPVGHGRVWYWFTAMDHSCWYPSVRLRRTKSPDYWRDIVGETAQDIFRLHAQSARLFANVA